MLRTINNTREKVASVMCLALDRPDAAEEVAEVIIQSLLISSTPVPRKIARLSVISDILHNCAGTPTNAWKYRSLFESKLPAVFTHLGEIYKSFPGRMKAEVFRKQIMTIMNVWEQWLVFNPSVLVDLEKRLSVGEDSDGRLRQENLAVAEVGGQDREPVHMASRPGFTAINASGKHEPEDDLDGDVLQAAAEADDLDGRALPTAEAVSAENMDGEPLDGEDLDGVPLV